MRRVTPTVSTNASPTKMSTRCFGTPSPAPDCELRRHNGSRCCRETSHSGSCHDKPSSLKIRYGVAHAPLLGATCLLPTDAPRHPVSTQYAVLSDLLAGTADVGLVRADLLSLLAEEGAADPGLFKCAPLAPRSRSPLPHASVSLCRTRGCPLGELPRMFSSASCRCADCPFLPTGSWVGG